MPVYTDVFGGATIYPSEISYSSLTLTEDVILSWPQETSANENLATRIIDIQASTSAYFIYLPEADKTATGQTILFNNIGTATISVKNADGTLVVAVTAGTLWQIYLTDNSTTAGVWSALQYGTAISQANAASLAGNGIVATGTLLSQSVPVSTLNTNYTAGAADRATMFLWTGAGGTITLTSPLTVGTNWFCYVRNSGTGAVVVDPAGAVLIDGGSNLSFQPGESAIITTDGINFYTIGFGQPAIFSFDYTTINVAGTGTYALSGTELNRISYKFTGALTGNRDIIVPATVQQYWVDNSTTGVYSLTVKTASGTGVTISQNARAILYSDGTNVVNADTFNIPFPLSIALGGTNATDETNARINLGGGATGIALFTASTQATAWAALGVAQSGTVDGGTF